MATERYPTFGDLLRHDRLAAGLTQEELAERAGISARGISDLERGARTAPWRQTVLLLAEALGLSNEDRRDLLEKARRRPASQAATTRLPDRREPSGLPPEPTPFVGRQREIEEVKHALTRPEVRLLTLTGPGGVGKTRLAVRVASELAAEFPHGVYFADLAGLKNPVLVASAIGEALGVVEKGRTSVFEGLKQHLREKVLLLVIDNFEHVLEAAPLVAQVLSIAPGVTVLATSRVRLHLSAEYEHRVEPLSVPDGGHLPGCDALCEYDAVRLFAQRAAAIEPGFQVTEESALAIAKICARVDGLPLAIELVTARVKVLPPQAMLARLDDRLGMLTEGPRDRPARHRTLRTTIDWSWDLLTDHEQKLLRRLSVFTGGATLRGIAAVCAAEGERDPVGGLTSLVDHSLVRRDEGSDDEPRFRMLETLREYALEKLTASGEAGELRMRHAQYYLQLAEHADRGLTGPAQRERLDELKAEHDNLRAALAWALDASVELGLRLAVALWRFWWVRGYLSEGRGWLEQGLARGANLPPTLRARALRAAGNLALVQTDLNRAQALCEQSLKIERELQEPTAVSAAVCMLGNVAWYQGDYARAVEAYEESLALDRQAGDEYGIVSNLGNLGQVALDRGEYQQAAVLLEDALAISRRLGDQWGISNAYNALGKAALYQGKYQDALEVFEQSLISKRALGDPEGVADSLIGMADTLLKLGDHGRADLLFREALDLIRKIGTQRALPGCLEGLAGVAELQGAPGRAALLVGAAESLREAVGLRVTPAYHIIHEERARAIRDQLGEAVFDRERRRGHRMSLEEIAGWNPDEPPA